MNPERAPLDSLIESIADGVPIDWPALEGATADERARRQLRHLRMIAEVADVHRSQTEDLTLTDAPSPRPVLDGVRWGHLLLIQKIGEGSFGEVFRARDPWLDREVALKLMKPAAAGEAVTRSRMLREAQALARVRHPNVVMVHGAAVHDDRVGLWMEFVRGRTLQDLLASQGAFGPSEAALCGQDLCRALAAVHAAGLVHRDIKAANVMREAGGRVVLMDFGAGQAHDVTLTWQLMGTPLCLSPEVLGGGRATVRSDIYSLGVLLFQLVTNQYPVVGGSFEGLCEAHRRGERKRLRDVRPDMPDAFVDVVERALDARPERRYSTAGEMQSALAAVTDSHGPDVVLAPQPRPWWRSPLSAIAMVLVVLCVALGVWASWKRGQAAAPVASRAAILAILPFQNLSADPGEAYLANAVPMELAARLGQIGILRVVPWTFMKQFDAPGESVKQAAERTGADAVIEGAVQRVPARSDGTPGPIQVRVQVISAGTGALLWSASIERDISDFFTMQAQIAREVADRLHVVLASRDQTLISRTRQVPAEAMEDYLNARQLLETQMNLPAAIALFRRATDRAPGFAEAHVGLSSCYALQSAYFGTVPADAAFTRAFEAADHAITLDGGIPEAWAARAFANFALVGHWSQAESDYRRALELGPASVDVLDSYSTYLTDRGRHAEAIEAARKAEERAPFSAVASRQVAWAYYMARQHENAIRQARRTLEIQPGYAPALIVLGRALLFEGRFDEGVAQLQAAGRDYEQMLATGYAMAGRRDDAMKLLARILSPSYDRPVVSYDIALTYAALGDHALTIQWLEKARTEKQAFMTELAFDPMLDPVRDLPQFKTLVSAVNSAK